MKVSDIMTHPVITATPETTVAEAAELMLRHRVSGLPVVDAAGEVMSDTVLSVGPDDPVADIIALMERRRVRRVPVIAPGNRPGTAHRHYQPCESGPGARAQSAAPDASGATSDQEIRDLIPTRPGP